MLRALLFCPLVFYLFLSTMLSQTFAEPKNDAQHLRPALNEHKGRSIHGHSTHESRKRGGRNYLLKRCNASEHSHDAKTPASSQVPPSTDRVITSSESKKWGLAWPNGDVPYLAHFARPKVRYVYTWSPYLPSMASSLGLEGIPMLWGWNQIGDFQNTVVQGYATKVLGMNEPNEPSQSNMSPQDGISLWMQYIDPLKHHGYYLISPACTNDQAGLDWMQSFVEGCTGCTIDAIAFHFYGTDPQAFINYATTLHDTYGKPIWVTEFADHDFNDGRQPTMSDIYAFQSAVVDFVENTTWIEAAFPFGAMHDLQGVSEGNLLLTADGWPTSLAYNYFG